MSDALRAPVKATVPQPAPPDGEVHAELRLLKPTQPKVPRQVPIGERLRRNLGFIILVVVPTLLATIYFGLLAADRYEVETRFVVRSPAATGANQIASMMQGSSIVRSADDAYVVHAYIESRDAVAHLSSALDLVALLNRPEVDLLARYPGPFAPANSETLWNHFQKFIAIDYDGSTGISTLRVNAYRPEDAQKLAIALLDNSESLINRMSNRAQGDTVRLAEAEVERARAVAVAAQKKMTDFRTREAIIDPAKASAAALEIIARLALELSQVNAQLNEIRAASPQNSQIATLRTRIAALEEQILKERKTLAGNDQSMAPLIAEYERLVLEREFAERTFASAVASLEAARLESQRQRLFLERITQPGLPDYAKYPRRLLAIVIVFLTAYMLYRIGRRMYVEMLTHAEI